MNAFFKKYKMYFYNDSISALIVVEFYLLFKDILLKLDYLLSLPKVSILL